MPTKLGYLIPTREHIMRESHDATTLIDAGKRAAALGFDSLWVGDSLTARPRHDPLTMLAGLATAVPDVDLGTAVLLPALRNPVLLAQQLATIDQLAQGRLIVGAGIAADIPPVRAEFKAAGVPFEKRVGRFMEGFRLMRALWSGEPVDWDGRWSLQNQSLAPLPYQLGGPRLWLGTSTPAGLQRCAKHFDGWMPIGPDLATFTERQQTLQAHRDERPITTALYATVAIDEDADAADRAINDYLLEYYGVPPAAMRGIQACCGGTLETVIAFLRSYAQAGADQIILRIVGDHQTTLNAIASARADLD
ncbi:MAG: LLM class flavin-dependent oxidoreductase [Pseudomonadales bacterium]